MYVYACNICVYWKTEIRFQDVLLNLHYEREWLYFLPSRRIPPSSLPQHLRLYTPCMLYVYTHIIYSVWSAHTTHTVQTRSHVYWMRHSRIATPWHVYHEPCRLGACWSNRLRGVRSRRSRWWYGVNHARYLKTCCVVFLGNCVLNFFIPKRLGSRSHNSKPPYNMWYLVGIIIFIFSPRPCRVYGMYCALS